MIYPTVGISVVFPFIMMLDKVDLTNPGDIVQQLSGSNYFLFIYFAVAFLATIVSKVSMSDNWEGNWIYKALPLNSPETIYRGAIKGIILRYHIPVCLLLGAAFLALYQWAIILDLLLVYLNMFLLTLLNVKVFNLKLPFSQEITRQASNNKAATFLIMGSGAVLALVHWVASLLPYGVIACIILTAGANLILWKRGLKFTWQQVE
jgi:hypothetical protein